MFVENLQRYTTQKRVINGNALTFVLETPRSACSHACSVDDVMRVLSCVPPDDLYLLDLVVFRQPKRKEEVLNGAWGRYYPAVDIKNLRGSAIFLEALDTRKPLRWEKPLSSWGLERLERLRMQGHTTVETPRYWEIYSTLAAVRETQLFETLPHEVGHHLHYTQDAEIGRRTKREKEEFAERYAREFIDKWGSSLK